MGGHDEKSELLDLLRLMPTYPIGRDSCEVKNFQLASRLAIQLGWHIHATKWLPSEKRRHDFNEKESREPGRPATCWDGDLNMFAATHLDKNSWIDCAASLPE